MIQWPRPWRSLLHGKDLGGEKCEEHHVIRRQQNCLNVSITLSCILKSPCRSWAACVEPPRYGSALGPRGVWCRRSNHRPKEGSQGGEGFKALGAKDWWRSGQVLLRKTQRHLRLMCGFTVNCSVAGAADLFWALWVVARGQWVGGMRVRCERSVAGAAR